jgi:hypothetical protein
LLNFLYKKEPSSEISSEGLAINKYYTSIAYAGNDQLITLFSQFVKF